MLETVVTYVLEQVAPPKVVTATSVLVGLVGEWKTSQTRNYMQLSNIKTRHNQPVCSQMWSVPCSKVGINLINVTSTVSFFIYDDMLIVYFPTLFMGSCKGTSDWYCLHPRKHFAHLLQVPHRWEFSYAYTMNPFNYMIMKHQRGFSSLKSLLNPLKSVAVTGFHHLNSKQL